MCHQVIFILLEVFVMLEKKTYGCQQLQTEQKGTGPRILEEDQWTKLQPQLGPLGEWVQFEHFVILCFVGVRMNMDFDFELVFLL
jgi:hypothetical protein